MPTKPSSEALVLPRMTAPAARTRSTTESSRAGTRSSNQTEPLVVRMPAVICVSLIGIGNPCRGADRVATLHRPLGGLGLLTR